ncbi:MAG: DUF5958 family protein [Planctomycetota bacterium]
MFDLEPDEVRALNLAAHDLDARDRLSAQFEVRDEGGQARMLGALASMAGQAGATEGDLPAALARSGASPNWTPSRVLALADVRFAERLHRVSALRPEHERRRALVLLLDLFAVADARRREACGEGCNHPWHRLGEAP